MDCLNIGTISEAEKRQFRATFRESRPFPHLVIRNVITDSAAAEIVEGFPDLEWRGWHRFTDPYQAEKRFCPDIETMPQICRSLLNDLASPTFLSFLTNISGIESLISDPYLEGGGLHCTGPGGKLSPHTDFHFYSKLKLYRQLNVLLYLNQHWSAEDGGELLLFNKDSPEPQVRVQPEFGTCVIFRTDHQSVHGVNPISTQASPRRSVATYYYTSTENRRFSGDTITYWQDHGRPEGLSKRRQIQLVFSRVLVLAGRGFAHLGHLTNPLLRGVTAAPEDQP